MQMKSSEPLKYCYSLAAIHFYCAKNELEDEEGMEIDKIEGHENRKCYNCQTIGHLAKDCRKAKREKQDKKEMTCNYCKKKGHFERECFKKKKEQPEKTKKKGGIKITKEDDEDEEESEALAIEYEEAEDISRIQEKWMRSRRSQYERSQRKEDFPVPSGKKGTH